MKLSELIESNEIISANIDFNTDIMAIYSDSRKVAKNSAFVAVRGECRDGNDYISQAIKNGAAVIITDDEKIAKDVPFVLVKSARSTISKMLAHFYGLNELNARIIAVTGTNGKSTVSYFIYNVLKCAKKRVGLISTVECLINGERIDLEGGGAVLDKASAMTTPDPEKLYKILAEMKKRDVEYIVIEVSSHALDQCRIDGIEVDFAVFTNLSCEHLDYHKTMENYFNAKELLFKKAHIGVVNVDDPYGKQILLSHKNIYSFSMNENADFSAGEINYTDELLCFTFNCDEKIEIKTEMIGRYNAYNASLAASVCSLLGISSEKIREGIRKTKVKGRLEKFRSNVYIDYAHTPKATEASLKAIKEKEQDKKIIALFGCGGERDRSKRAEIGKIASRLADAVIITSDNSRGEDPLEIIKDILVGVDREKMHMVIPKRRDAIEYGAKILKENEVLILLGKGHETYEIDKNGKHFFDERVILGEVFGNDKGKAEMGE